MTSSPLSVVIIGAGSASIRLAHTLLTESPKPIDVTILEANDYIGGRVRNRLFEGHTVEMGANWISGREAVFNNPIWKLAQEIDLRVNPSDRENPKRMHVVDCTNNDDCNGGVVVTDLYLEQVKRFDDVYAKSLEQMALPASTVSFQEDVDVRALLEQNGWTHKSDLTNIERAVEHNTLEVWVVDDLNQLSATHDMKAGANDMDLGQDEVFVEDPRGFNTIFAGMLRELKESKTTTIHLEKEAQRVQYVPGDTKVTAKDLKTGEFIEYKADVVVSTVSLGVLQDESHLSFYPPFPKWKVEALHQIRMFNFAKVFAKFQTGLWPDDKDYVLLISDGEGNRGYYPLWMRYKHSKDNLLMCYLGGAQARRVEKLSENEIKDELEDLFGRAFGRSKPCRPVAVAVTDWSINPRFRGSYSYFPKGAFSSIPLSYLGYPLRGAEETDAPSTSYPKTLYFAGEAFDDSFNGWIQGGFLSGERVARTIIQDRSVKTD